MNRKPLRVLLLVFVFLGGLTAQTATSEDYEPMPASSGLSAFEVLDGLTDEERTNAIIDLEILDISDDGAVLREEKVEALWNLGRTADALAVVEELEGAGSAVAVGITWKDPKPSLSAKYYPDVAIGGGRTGFERAAIGYSRASENIFVMIQWADVWTMNISTDMGESFSETYVWTANALADMTVVGNHAWVGYATSGSVRMRRFFLNDGTVDAGYGWVEIENIDPEYVNDLVVESNAPDTNNRIYVAYTNGSDAAIRLSHGDLTGTNFTSIPTGISFAWYGLDLAWNPHPSSPTEGNIWISFIDSNPDVQVYTNFNSVFFRPEASQPFTGSARFTGLSAHEDNVYCVFEKDNGSGQAGVGYLNSSDAGGIWRIGDVFMPVPGAANSRRPDVTVRSGSVPTVTFATDEPSTDLVWHTQRDSMSVGPWDGPFHFNSHNASLGTPNVIEWLDVPCVRSHGLVYGADDDVPYFDLIRPRCFFNDGFESADTSAWSNTNP